LRDGLQHRRKMSDRVQLTNNDHWFFVRLYHWFSSIRNALTINRALSYQEVQQLYLMGK
jgi:hypothetical protein